MNTFELSAPMLLIADDDPLVITSLADRCRRMGFVTEPSASGRSTLIKLGQCVPSLSSLNMNGRWPILLKRDRPSLHIVVMRGRPAIPSAENIETKHILKGSSFWNKFDAVLAETFSLRRRVEKKPAEKPLVVNRPQVLLVDDDIHVRSYIFSGLRKLGIQPSFAPDGTLAFWKARKSPPAVIVSDYFMPNGNAEALLARLRSTPETRNVPFIVQSGRELGDVIKNRLQGEVCGQAGASLVLKKSFGARELFGNLEIMCGLTKAVPTELMVQ